MVKEKKIPELTTEEWLADLAFFLLVETGLMNEVNSKLQGKGLFAHVKAHVKKLLLLARQVRSNTLHTLSHSERDSICCIEGVAWWVFKAF